MTTSPGRLTVLLTAAALTAAAGPGLAQETQAEDSSFAQLSVPPFAELEVMLTQVDQLIAKHDAEINRLNDLISETDDRLERLRLEDIVFRWTGVLDALEDQRGLLGDLLDTSRQLREASATECGERP